MGAGQNGNGGGNGGHNGAANGNRHSGGNGAGRGGGNGEASSPAPRPVRCAVYVRKSTEEGLQTDFNSLDAQREAAEAYIASQRHEGWVCLPEEYSDGGYTGANTNRPALQRLLEGIEAGAIDCVVVYKLDRLSRSILDFAKMMEFFNKHGAQFVSVTQSFNTSTSAGRLTVNLLSMFAQFEREQISERTRDKMRAAKKRGRWIGGMPPFGYDVDPKGGKLLVNEAEAARVREIFGLYSDLGSLGAVANELNRRGWRTKSWTTRDGKQREGGPWAKPMLQRLLTSPIYVGKVSLGGEVFAGEHAAILDEATFARTQALLAEGRVHPAPRPRPGSANPSNYLLKNLVRCTACGSAMCAASARKGTTQYRYYRCTKTALSGSAACPVGNVPAGEIERLVIERIRALGRDPALIDEVVAKAGAAAREKVPGLREEEKALVADERRLRDEAARIMQAFGGTGKADGDVAGDEKGNDAKPAAHGLVASRLAELDARAARIRDRIAEIARKIAEVESTTIDEGEARRAIETFEVWDALEPRERERLVRLIVERVDYDGVGGEIRLALHPTGIRALAEEAGTGDADGAGEENQVEEVAKP